jgi:hypothetical protein
MATTLVVPNVEMIRGLKLPGTPRATSACRGTPLILLRVARIFGMFYSYCFVIFIVKSTYNSRHILLILDTLLIR